VTRRIDWSDDALADLGLQIAYIARHDPDAAAAVARGIRDAGNGLASFATGHPGRVAGTYEKSVARIPYIIAYALDDDGGSLTILRVIHSRRDWPKGNWPAG
jgi:plasmid stabilization system protein ParE